MPQWNDTYDIMTPTLKLNGAGMLIFTIQFELDTVVKTYFRKSTAIWDLLAYIGGFSVAMVFFGDYLYNFIKSNGKYVLSQAYMRSQYQTRTRDVKTAIDNHNKEKTEADEIKEEAQDEVDNRD